MNDEGHIGQIARGMSPGGLLPGMARLACVGALVLATAPAASADPSKVRLEKALDRIVARPALAHALWGLEVRSLATGRVLYSRNADKAFRPASTLKLVTTAAALDALGPLARLRTTLETAARLDGLGRLLGDVFLVGRGDPSLSEGFHEGRPLEVFEDMAEALLAAGVRRIEGRLVGHEGAFQGERRGPDWTWEDLAWGYGAEVSALSFHDNALHLRLRPGERPGDPALLDVTPRTPLVPVLSTVVTGASGSEEDIVLVRPPGANRILLSGSLPPGGEWEGEVAVEDPALFATTVLAAVLEAKGIVLTGGVATTSEPLTGTRVLAVHEGVPMARLIAEVNKESQNLHAELMLRLLGERRVGDGSAESGLEAVAAFLQRLRVSSDGWGIRDGSGLARSNLVTPHGLVSLLAAMDDHPYAAAFRESLAVAGIDGTLEKRMNGTAAEGRVRAKTGSLRGVNALAGYVTSVRGSRLAFAAFVNNHQERADVAVAALDDLAVALATAR